MRFGVAALIAAVGCLLFMAGRGRSGQQGPSYPQKSRVEDDGAAKYGGPPPAPEEPVPAAPAAAIGHQHASDGQQPRTKYRKWSRGEILSAVSACATLAASAFAAVALVIAIQAVNEARRQADAAYQALIVTDRPWIKVVGLSDVRVEVRDTGVVMRSKIAVRNIGRAPAQRTFVNSRLIANPSIDDSAEAAVDMCRRAIEGGYYTATDELIFPSEDRVFFEISLIDLNEIVQDNEARNQERFALNKRVFGEKLAVEIRKREDTSLYIAGLDLIGCVTYIIPSANVVGQISFIYGIYQTCGDERGGLCVFNMARPGAVEGGDVIIQEPIGGTFAR